MTVPAAGDVLSGTLAARVADWARNRAADAMAARRTPLRRLVGRLARRPFAMRIAGDGPFNLAEVEGELGEQSDALAQAWTEVRAYASARPILLGCRLERARDARRRAGVGEPLHKGEHPPDGRFEMRIDLGKAGAGTALVFEARPRRDADFERLSRWLSARGARGRPHYAGTLHDHLMRTYALLEGRGLPLEVRLAGGLHSVHGTSLLAFALLPDDAGPDVAAEFGGTAARLARLFSLLDRPGALDEPLSQSRGRIEARGRDGAAIALSAHDFSALRWMECANLVDQGSLEGFPNLAALWEAAVGPAADGQLSATPSNRPIPKVTAAAR
jgi:hypothetical protein